MLKTNQKTGVRWVNMMTLGLTVVLSTLAGAACGGVSGDLHAVLDAAEERNAETLENLESARPQIEAALEFPGPEERCPPGYRPDTFQWPPPYRDVVEMPELLNDDSRVQREGFRCRDINRDMQRHREGYERLIAHLKDPRWEEQFRLMRYRTDERLDDEEREEAWSSIREIVETTAPDEDTLVRRFQTLATHLQMYDHLNLLSNANLVEDVLAGIQSTRDRYTVAAEYLRNWNDYQRQIYEGPDSGER